MKQGQLRAVLVVFLPVFTMALQAQELVPKAELIERSEVIAVIQLEEVRSPTFYDASIDGEISIQRARAKVIQVIQGEFPENPIIQNNPDSILTSGTHLAFLRKLGPERFGLVAPNALYRIEEGRLYWFSRQPVSLSHVIAEIEN